MYILVLTVHSWLRWVVVTSTGVAFLASLVGWVRTSRYGRLHRAAGNAFTGTLNLQFILGLTLYALSPLVRTAWSEPGAAMGNSALRFFMIEHQFAAFLAVGLAHVGMARARRAVDDRQRHRTICLVSGCCLLVLATVIPWPALPYGRALFRFSWGR